MLSARHARRDMCQILVKQLFRNRLAWPLRRSIYQNLIGGGAGTSDIDGDQIDIDSYHFGVSRAMNDHITHRFIVSHSYLTIGNNFERKKRFDGFKGSQL